MEIERGEKSSYGGFVRDQKDKDIAQDDFHGAREEVAAIKLAPGDTDPQLIHPRSRHRNGQIERGKHGRVELHVPKQHLSREGRDLQLLGVQS